MALAHPFLRFYSLTLVFSCCVLQRRAIEATKEKVLLKEPDNMDRWKGWNQQTHWQQSSNFYLVCNVGVSSSDLLTSPFLPLPPTVKNVQVTAKYNVRSCDSFSPVPSPCKTKVEFLMKEQDLRSPFPGISDYVLLKTETPEKANLTTDLPGNVPPKITSVLSVNIQKKGVYFAIYVQSVCIVLFEFKVSYGICASEGINLMTFPETVSPPAGSQSINVTGACVKHAVLLERQFTTPYAFCDSNSHWTADANVSCVCIGGYRQKAVLNICEVCPADTFKKEVGLESCCPLHSSQDTPPVRCKCDEGYYRNDKEDDYHNCTSIPSAPVDVMTVFINASATRLQWKHPKDTGGRTDLFYEIQCSRTGQLPCSSNIRYYPGRTDLTQTSVIIFNLKPFTSYKFEVFSKNGVSKVAEKANSAQIVLINSESTPGVPTGVKITRGKDLTAAYLEWTLEEANGNILFYEVSYYNVDTGSRKKVNSSYTNITIHGLDPNSDYRFQIRAYTSKGYGQSSEEVGFKKKRETSSTLTVVVTVLVVLLACSLAGVFGFFLYKRQKNKRKVAQNCNNFSNINLPSRNEIDGPDQRPVDYDEIPDEVAESIKWEFPRDNLKLVKPLGSGEFGQVYKGKATGLQQSNNNVEVAVKLLKGKAGQQEKKDFLAEVQLMRRLEPHRHVVKLLACCTLKEPFLAILEYLPYGDLLGVLRRSRGKDDKHTTGELRPNSNLTSKDLLKFAWMIADGMAFLANKKIVHRDLAARNVLVGENLTCKISDFGLARNLAGDVYSRKSKARLPIKWMPPESIFLGECTSKSDVWSYGIVLWEVFTIGDVPYPNIKGRDLPPMLEKGYRMSKPKHLSKEIFSVVLDCWSYNPNSRPTFNLLETTMDKILQKHTNYINLEVYDDQMYVNFEMIENR